MNSDEKYFRFPFKAMGSPCEIQLFAETFAEAKRISDLAITDVRRLEARYSRYRSDSLLSAINRVAAEGGRITVDEETAGLLNYAATCYEQSDGLFDITSGILRRAWRFEQGSLPDDTQVRGLLERIGWHKLRWEPPVLEFPVPGMELDFGGIVKEYAVDRAAALCRSAGVRHGVINLGGDIKLIGARADGHPWRVGISHPRKKGSMIRTLALRDGAVASSGDYERCIVVEGVRFGHVLNPKTGWPVRHLAAVSVVGDFCVVAGSASTIAMLKEKDGPAWLEAMGLPHLWVDVDGNVGGPLAASTEDSK
ncbi:FAD:protein FMN transferase [Methylocaldum szegediense]|uniref:FAD:protein FMN transferase n=2 Tax=Methylocaldum szegediense TaxID=73780 RepID=A0ABM9HZ98_9GAMM|nr:FAD:protein FMN transferase [Methylocaldum szegediense]